jgi:hypothetical protein
VLAGRSLRDQHAAGRIDDHTGNDMNRGRTLPTQRFALNGYA